MPHNPPQSTVTTERTQTFAALLDIQLTKGLSSQDDSHLASIRLGLMVITSIADSLGRPELKALQGVFEEEVALRNGEDDRSVSERTAALAALAKRVAKQVKAVRKAYAAAAKAFAKAEADTRRKLLAVREAGAELLVSDAAMLAGVRDTVATHLTEARELSKTLDTLVGDFQDGAPLHDVSARLETLREALESGPSRGIEAARSQWSEGKKNLGKLKGLKDLVGAFGQATLYDAVLRVSMQAALDGLVDGVATGSMSRDTARSTLSTLAERFEYEHGQSRQRHEEQSARLEALVKRVNRLRRRLPGESASLLAQYVDTQTLFEACQYDDSQAALDALEDRVRSLKQTVIVARQGWRARETPIRRLEAQLARQATWEEELPFPVARQQALLAELKSLGDDINTRKALESVEALDRIADAIAANAEHRRRRSVPGFQQGLDAARAAFDAAANAAAAAIDALETDAFVSRAERIRREAEDGDWNAIVANERREDLELRWMRAEQSFELLLEQYALHGGDPNRSPRQVLVEVEARFRECLREEDWDGALAQQAFLLHELEGLGQQVVELSGNRARERAQGRAYVEGCRRIITRLRAHEGTKGFEKLGARLDAAEAELRDHVLTLDTPVFGTADILQATLRALDRLEDRLTALEMAVSEGKKAFAKLVKHSGVDREGYERRYKVLKNCKKKYPEFQPEGVASLLQDFKLALDDLNALTWPERTILDGKFEQLVAGFTRYMDASMEAARKGREAVSKHGEIEPYLKRERALQPLWNAYRQRYKALEGIADPIKRLVELEEVLAEQDRILEAMSRQGPEQRKALALLAARAEADVETRARNAQLFEKEYARLKAIVDKPWYRRALATVLRRKSLDYGGPEQLLQTAKSMTRTGEGFEEGLRYLRLAQNQIDSVIEDGVQGGDAIGLRKLQALEEQWGELARSFEAQIDRFVDFFGGIDELSTGQKAALTKALESLRGAFSASAFTSAVSRLKGEASWDARTKAAEHGLAVVRKYKERLLGEPRIEQLTHCPIKGNPGLGLAGNLYRTLDRLERNFHMARPTYKG